MIYARIKSNFMRNRQPIVKSILLSLALWLLSSAAYADMLVSPTRVIMNDANRSATLILRNTSNGSRTYRLSWQDKRANENGSYTIITEDEEWPSAKEMIRLSPRQITVGPNENQTVRFNWRPPADLPSGEYRSHLLLEVIPDISEPTATMGVQAPVDEVGIQIFMQMSFSIPVVVRHNTDAPQVSIGDVKALPVNDGKHMGLELTFNRDGNASSFGRVLVEMQRNSESPVEQIGEYGELSIFQEVGRRKITIRLRDASIPEGAWVRVAYEGLNEYQGILWDEKVFQAK
ncbi:MAG: fimbrial chaperone protein [Granulosicoccus sp.]|jgi:fimbrial chaperone protein